MQTEMTIAEARRVVFDLECQFGDGFKAVSMREGGKYRVELTLNELRRFLFLFNDQDAKVCVEQAETSLTVIFC